MRKAETLRNKEDFSRLRNKGKSVGTRYAVIVYVPNNKGLIRRAFLASKKVGNSISRHRAVRLLRESFRLIEKECAVSEETDFLFIAKSAINNANCADVKKNIEAAMRKSGLIA